VPNSWNFSRFLSNLIAVETEQGLVSQMLIDLREQLMAVLPDFGQHLGYDGKAIDSHSTAQDKSIARADFVQTSMPIGGITKQSE
jgi:hypothetical protein